VHQGLSIRMDGYDTRKIAVGVGDSVEGQYYHVCIYIARTACVYLAIHCGSTHSSLIRCDGVNLEEDNKGLFITI